MSDPAIAAREVTKDYEGGLVQALRGVSFTIERGEAVAITGPSGSGKTTLLHLLGALDLPTSGSVAIFGSDLTAVRDLDRFRNRTTGFVFQLHNLIPNLPLWENVALPTHPLGIGRSERRKRAAAVLERVGLGHRVEFLPIKCSGGERQRAAVARALVNEPDLLLADEPTGSVDTVTGERILSLFDEIHRERGTTVVTITHDEYVARHSGRALDLVDGRLADAAGG